jgi:hypothetical protein
VANIYSIEVLNNTWLPMINQVAPGSVELVRKLIWAETPTTDGIIRMVELTGAILALAAVAWGVVRTFTSRAITLSTSGKELARLSCFAFVAALAVYGWFVRPGLARVDPAWSPIETAVQMNAAQSLIRLGWYISPLGVLLGLAGLAKGLIDELNSKVLFFVVMALPTSALLLFNGFIYPVHFWAGRRLIYVVIPSFLLLAAYALLSLRRGAESSVGNGWRSNIIPASIALALILTIVRPSLQFIRHIEYDGATAQVAELASSLPENSVVLFENSLESNWFTAPLKYLYNKDVRALEKVSLSDPRMASLVQKWESQGRRVLWIGVTKETAAPTGNYALSQLGTKVTRIPEADRTTDYLPFKTNQFVMTMNIYELIPAN